MERVGNKAHYKNFLPLSMYDLRPVVLTSNIIKCLENMLKTYVCDSVKTF